jgi:tight adherence protein C
MSTVYLILGALCVGVAVAGFVSAASTRRVRTSERLASIHEYGYAAEAQDTSFMVDNETGSVANVVTEVGGLFERLVGRAGESSMRRELMAAGMYSTSPRTLIGYRVFAMILLPVLIAVLLGPSGTLHELLVLFMIFAGWSLPMVIVQRRARFRLEEIDRKMPDLIDLLTVMIEAGLSFRSGLRGAAEQFGPPLSDELRLTLQEQTMGLSIEDALGNMMSRCPTVSVTSFVRAMANGERMGISTGQIMRNLAHEMRLRRRQLAEEKAQKAPVRMLFPLVFLIFPAMFIVLLGPAVINLLHTGF